MNIHPIASSSDGNCTLISTDKTSIAIDAGVTLRRMKSLAEKIDGIFISHEHTDHIDGGGVLSRYYRCPVYMHKLCYRGKKYKLGECEVSFVEPGETIEIGDLTIFHFSTEHDVNMSFGYLISQDKGPSFCYVTDSGMITPLMADNIMKADALLIEADYDEKLLQEYDDYDDWLKERISSNVGHLSNQQTISFLKEIGIDRFSAIIFAHLSPRTNTHETLMKIASNEFPEEMDKFMIAPLRKSIELVKHPLKPRSCGGSP